MNWYLITFILILFGFPILALFLIIRFNSALYSLILIPGACVGVMWSEHKYKNLEGVK